MRNLPGDGMAAPEPEITEKIVYRPIRKRLPDERPSITHKFSIAGHEGYLHIGLYPASRMPGEIFITMAKEGSTISGLMDAFATSISIALQYGVPLADLCNKFSHMRFEPNGFTQNKEIPITKSIMDYIFRYLSLKFMRVHKEEETDSDHSGEEQSTSGLCNPASGPDADATFRAARACGFARRKHRGSVHVGHGRAPCRQVECGHIPQSGGQSGLPQLRIHHRPQRRMLFVPQLRFHKRVRVIRDGKVRLFLEAIRLPMQSKTCVTHSIFLDKALQDLDLT